MLTFREARQRLSLAGMGISRVGASCEYRVAPQHLFGSKQEKSAYYTDDLEDAMLTGLKMSRLG